jgi:hypothetical protein
MFAVGDKECLHHASTTTPTGTLPITVGVPQLQRVTSANHPYYTNRQPISMGLILRILGIVHMCVVLEIIKGLLKVHRPTRFSDS